MILCGFTFRRFVAVAKQLRFQLPDPLFLMRRPAFLGFDR